MSDLLSHDERYPILYISMHGLFLFHKPSGPSSAQFLNQIKRAFSLSHSTRIGHGGTLDPFASGLLVVGISRAYTKSLNHQLLHTTKEYRAEIVLGASSDTDDHTGVIQNISSINNSDVTIQRLTSIVEWKEKILLAIEKLKNQETQIPPQYSAIKIQGKPAYARKRIGETLTLSPKKVSLITYTLESVQEKNGLIYLTVTLLVSSGFYIRSFARDLGELLGVGGYVQTLERTKIGLFSLKNVLYLDDLDKDVELRFWASGVVQNVGFRAFARDSAQELHIVGFSRNIDKNRVEVVGQGKLIQLQEFLTRLSQGPTHAHLEQIESYFGRIIQTYTEFVISE